MEGGGDRGDHKVSGGEADRLAGATGQQHQRPRDSTSDTMSEASETSSFSMSDSTSIISSVSNTDRDRDRDSRPDRLVVQVVKYDRRQHPSKAGKKQTCFQVRVCPNERNVWTVSRTYHDFESLHEKLSADLPSLAFPEKDSGIQTKAKLQKRVEDLHFYLQHIVQERYLTGACTHTSIPFPLHLFY